MSKLSEHEAKMWEVCNASYEMVKDKATLNGSELTKLVVDIMTLENLMNHVRANHKTNPKALPLFRDLDRATTNMMNMKFRMQENR
jgi:hypothetical protein